LCVASVTVSVNSPYKASLPSQLTLLNATDFPPKPSADDRMDAKRQSKPDPDTPMMGLFGKRAEEAFHLERDNGGSPLHLQSARRFHG